MYGNDMGVRKADSYRPYILKEISARGGQSQIYKAEEESTKEIYAIKAIQSGRLPDEEVAKKLLREVWILKELQQSSFCVTLHDIFVFEKELCMVLDYCNGGNLERFMKRRKTPLTFRERLHILWNVGCAIMEMHRLGLTHRDIKPENVLLISEGEDITDVKLCDFGFSKDLAEATGTLLSNPDYTSPEVWRILQNGEGTYDNKVDIWGFGVMMFYVLFGILPFKHKENTLPKFLKGEPLHFPEQKDPNYNEYIDLMTRCLESDPKHRPSIMEVLQHKYFYLVVIPRRKSLAPYKKKSDLKFLTPDTMKCSKSGSKDYFVIKKIDGKLVSDEATRKRLCHEIATLIRLRNCPSIVRIVDYFSAGGSIYLVIIIKKNNEYYTLCRINSNGCSVVSEIKSRENR